jgi:hypothetical protein
MKKFVVVPVLAGALIAPASASADVLVERHSNIIVGSCVSISYWYQAYSGGSRYISAAVYKNGHRITGWRTVRATGRWGWRALYCPEMPGGRYRVKYRYEGHTSWSLTIRVGIGD